MVLTSVLILEMLVHLSLFEMRLLLLDQKWNIHTRFDFFPRLLFHLLYSFEHFILDQVPVLSHSFQLTSNVCGCLKPLVLVVWCSCHKAWWRVYWICPELLEIFYGARCEQSLIVLTAIQLQSSLTATIGTSMGQRGYNGLIDHLWSHQSMQLLTKLSVMEPELSGRSLAQPGWIGLGVCEVNVYGTLFTRFMFRSI